MYFDNSSLKWEVGADLADGKAKDLLKVGRLADQEQVKGPAAAEIGHNDSVDGHGGKEATPWSLKFLWISDYRAVSLFQLETKCVAAGTDEVFLRSHLGCTHLVHIFSNCGFNVSPLLLGNGGMCSWTPICQQEPQDVPYDSKHTCPQYNKEKRYILLRMLRYKASPVAKGEPQKLIKRRSDLNRTAKKKEINQVSWTRYESSCPDRKMLIHINKSWDYITADFY